MVTPQVIGAMGVSTSRQFLGLAFRNLNQITRAIFKVGDNGFVYDPLDLSTMYQDAAGTNPVTGVVQAVGLMLDKSKPVLSGSNILSNFLTVDGWVKADPSISISVVGGMLRVSKGGTELKGVYKPFQCEANKLYRLSVKFKNHTGNNVRFHIRNANALGTNPLLFQTIQTGSATDGSGDSFFISTADTHSVVIDSQNAAESSVDIESISVVKVSDSINHAYQTTSSMRPLLKQRSSELVINGDFGNGIAGWTKNGTATVAVSGGILTVQANGTASGVYQDLTVKPNTKYRISLTVSAYSRVAVYGNWAFTQLIGSAHSGVLEFTPTSDKVRVYLYCNVSDVGTFDNVSLRKVVEDSYISNAISFDTTDDKLTTTLPAQLTGCTVVRAVPNVGTQILTNQTISTTHNDNADHCGLIVINRALTATETAQITKLFNKAAGV